MGKILTTSKLKIINLDYNIRKFVYTTSFSYKVR